jgi:hypothetical protein
MSTTQQITANQTNGIGDRSPESCPFAVIAKNSDSQKFRSKDSS